MFKIKNMPIRNKIILLITLTVLLPLAGAGTYLYLSQSAYLQQSLSSVLTSVSNATARSMDRFIVQRGPELELASGSSTLRNTPESANYGMSRYLSTFSDFDSLVFVDPAGKVITSQGTILLSKGENRLEDAVRRWHAEAQKGAKLIDVIAEPGQFDRYLVYVAPVRHNNVDYGWLFGQVNSERVAETAIAVKIGNSGRATLFNKDGRLIGHENKSRYGYDMSRYSVMDAPLTRSQGNPGDLFISGDGDEKWGTTLLLENSLKRYGLKWGLIVDQASAEMYAPIHQIRNSILMSILICLVIFVPLGGLLAVRQISTPIQRMVNYLKVIATGDFTKSVSSDDKNRTDEIGILAVALDDVAENLSRNAHVAEQIADGNLNVEVQLASEKDQLGLALQTMVLNLNDILGQIQVAAEQIASGSGEVADSSQALSQGATESASSLEEISASLHQLASQTGTNAENANTANQLSAEARNAAQQGSQKMQDMVAAMTEINQAGQSISKIIKVIDEIAFQTNLLALNAAVEAARAGQHGKGFAVVAEEVRNLAARSAKAAQETSELIEGSVQKTANGTTIAGQTATALQSIVGGIGKVTDLVAEIAAASSEQAQGVAQINQGITQIDQVTQQNTASAEESAAASEELSGQAAQLREMLMRFTLKGGSSSRSNVRAVPQKKAAAKNDGWGKSAPVQPQKKIAAKQPISLDDDEFGKF